MQTCTKLFSSPRNGQAVFCVDGDIDWVEPVPEDVGNDDFEAWVWFFDNDLSSSCLDHLSFLRFPTLKPEHITTTMLTGASYKGVPIIANRTVKLTFPFELPDARGRSLRQRAVASGTVFLANITKPGRVSQIQMSFAVVTTPTPSPTPTPTPLPTPTPVNFNCAGKTQFECLNLIINNIDEGQSLSNDQISDIINSLDDVLKDVLEIELGSYNGKGSYADDVPDKIQTIVIELLDIVKVSAVNNLECGESSTFEGKTISLEAEKLEVSQLSDNSRLQFENNKANFEVDAGSIDNDGCITTTTSEVDTFPTACAADCPACEERVSSLFSLTFHDQVSGLAVDFKDRVIFSLPIDDNAAEDLRQQGTATSGDSGSETGSDVTCGGSEESGTGSGYSDERIPQCTFFNVTLGCFDTRGCKRTGQDLSVSPALIHCECNHLTDFSVVFADGGGGGGNGGGGNCVASESVEIFTPIFIASLSLFGAACCIVIIICAVYHYVRKHQMEKAKASIRKRLRRPSEVSTGGSGGGSGSTHGGISGGSSTNVEML